MAENKPINPREILDNLLLMLQDEEVPELKRIGRTDFISSADILRLAKEDPAFLEILTDPSDELIDELRNVYRSSIVGETTDVMGSVRSSLKGVKGAAPVIVSSSDLLPGTKAIGSFEPDYTGRGTGTREYVGFKSPEGAVLPEGDMETRRGIRRRGETAGQFGRRVDAAGRAASPGLALTPEQARSRGMAAIRTPAAPAKPIKLPEGAKGTFGRNLKAKYLNLKRGITGPMAKMGLIGGSLAGLGAYLTLMEILDEAGQGLNSPSKSMSKGLIEGYGPAMERIGTPSVESAREESRVLREIAEAGQGQTGISRELRDLVDVTDKELQYMRQRVNPTMREAYARAGLL